MQTFFLLPVVGGGRLLDEPKDCLQRRLRQRFNRSFFINHHSHLKMTTSPVKLCLLPTPTPSALRSRLYVSIKGVSWNFKTRWTSVYFPLLPAPTGTNVFHFDMIYLFVHLQCRSALWLAHAISKKRVRTFSTDNVWMQGTTQRTIKLLGLLLPDLSIKKSAYQTLL